MPVPVPITLSLADPPDDWQASSPGQFSALLNLIAGLLTGSMDNLLLTGQVGGSAPTQDVGPWATQGEWWFYDSSFGYQPSEQGCPVGTVTPWGGNSQSTFPYGNWLPCEGQEVSRTSYRKLFSRIGTTWGAGNGSTTFNLPPNGRLYLNSAALNLNPAIKLDAGYPADGSPGTRGGSQLCAPLTAPTLPRLKISVPYLNPGILDNEGVDIPNITMSGPDVFDYPVLDEKQNPIGSGQQVFSIMPPFVSITFMIKFL